MDQTNIGVRKTEVIMTTATYQELCTGSYPFMKKEVDNSIVKKSQIKIYLFIQIAMTSTVFYPHISMCNLV